MDLGLDGKRAIITGGSRGIGLEIARTLIAEGSSVAICARGASGVEEAVAELGDRAWGSAVDVSNPDEYTEWMGHAIDHLGGLDIFIGNVAFTPDADAETRWKAAFDVDLMHCVRGCTAARSALADSDWGSIVLISSVSNAMTELPEEERAYGAMKAALVSYAGQLAQELAAEGTRVNSVSPGPVFFEGGVWDQIRTAEPEFYEFALTLPALGRLGTPEEVARTVAFVASPASSFTTGSNIRLDGGTLKTVNL
ncbi:MAG: SDR family oxidoreductase [Acidimicrobiales bacterium]|nr:SDR family oxidoreductase [Acidimicrobiales bacterium]RZV46373.1 MAG: SDR family oxidoreductase [Acidimicrobiales bacterium]